VIASMCNPTSVADLQPLNLSALEQIQKDWTQRPFVRATVSSKPCEGADIVPMFTRHWRGTVKGCALETGEV